MDTVSKSCTGVIGEAFNGIWPEWLEPSCALTVGPITTEVPFALFLLGCLPPILTAYYLVRLAIQVFPLRTQIRAASKAAEGLPISGMDGAARESFRAKMESLKLLRNVYGEFDETLLVESDDSGVKIYNTRQAQEFFNAEALLDEAKISQRFYNSFPAILTSIGLGVTFISILLGLSHIKSVEGKITGIESLVTSLSGKFFSSILALISAIVFSLLANWLLNIVQHRIHRFVTILNQRLKRRSQENLLEAMLPHMAEQSMILRQFGTDISGSFKVAVREGMGPLEERLSSVLEELRSQLEKQKSEQHDALSHMLSELTGKFQSNLMGSATNEFQSLATTVTRTGELLETMNQQMSGQQERMVELMTRFDETMTSSSRQSEAYQSRLAATMDEVIAKLEQTTSSSSTSLGQSIERVLSRLEDSTNRQATQMSEALGTVIAQLQEVSSSSSSSIGSSIEQALQRMDDSLQRQLGVASEMGDGMAQLVRQITESAQSSVDSTSSALQRNVDAVLARAEDWSRGSSAQAQEVMAVAEKNAAMLTRAQQSLQEALTTFEGSLKAGGGMLDGVKNTAQTLVEGSNRLSTILTSTTGIQERAESVMARIDKSFHELEPMLTRLMTEQQTVVARYERSFGELDARLGSILGEIGRKMEQYNGAAKASFENTLGSFDKQLNDATRMLARATEELRTTVEELGEALLEARTNVTRNTAAVVNG